MYVPSQFSKSSPANQSEMRIVRRIKTIAEQMHLVAQQLPHDRPPQAGDFTPAIVAQLDRDKKYAEQVFRELHELPHEQFCFVMEMAVMVLASRVASAAPSTAAVVIYGPEGCGKSRHAAALAAHYGKSAVVDDWMPGQPLPANALALTTEPNQPGAIPFDVAMREAGLAT